MEEFSVKQSPIIRWVGGKSKLLEEIHQHIPLFDGTFYEPFVGGGAVVFSLLPHLAIVADKNEELINFYNQIKDDWETVCDLAQSFKNDEKSYYEIRLWDRDCDFTKTNDVIKRAARFLYLNKTSFQGLWRVNIKKGYNNTPYGRPKNFLIKNEAFQQFSKNIQNVTFLSGDFEEILKTAKAGDFVYFDPPYIPISDTSSFTAYTLGGFTNDDQLRLLACCKHLDEIGVKWLLSNSNCVLTHELYSDFKINVVEVKRLVSAKSSSRGNITEVLVSNY